MKILAIGHAAYDTTIPVDGYPKENTKNRVKQQIECGGGPACNAAYLLGKWGLDVAFAGVVGKDRFGEKIKQELTEAHVNTDYLAFSETGATTSSTVIVNTETGSRTILTYRSDQLEYQAPCYPVEPDIILIDGQEYAYAKMVLKQYPKAIGIIDAGRSTPEIQELCSLVDYVVCSHDFAEQVSGITIDYENHQTLIDNLRYLQQRFQTNIVITLEAHGCLYEYDGMIKIMPSITVEAKDTTGAGDIFHGAFTYAIAKHYPFEDCLRIGNLAGAISATRIGSKPSMPEKEEMRKYFYEFK
ncbi:MAG: hypothetical protein HFG15_02420 [Bacilli bacterium]|jgi:sulfofructose kinase|nr:hypothetical protein [Bacilli bacterium]